MSNLSKKLGRRAMLRGSVAGALATIALPTLDAMLNSTGTALAGGTPIPKRYGLWFWGNGILVNRWVPDGTGPDWQPSPQLSPLGDADIKPYVSVLTGFETVPPPVHLHAANLAALLTGMDSGPHPESAIAGDKEDFMAATVDQTIAEQIGAGTAFPSLDLGAGSALYQVGGPIFWSLSSNGPGSPNKAMFDPEKVFMRLFGSSSANGPKLDMRASVLDAVLADSQSLRSELGAADKERLDAHLDGIRTLEQRIGHLKSCDKPADPSGQVDITKIGDNAYSQLREMAQVQSQLLALALSCDLTRVFSFMFTNVAAHIPYQQIGLSDSFHELCHNEAGDVQPSVDKGVTYAMSCLADTLKTLQGVTIGDGNLLDHSAILATSDLAEGRHHSWQDYPLLVIGKAGGKLRSGIHYRSTSKTSTVNVTVSLLRALDMPVDGFGVGERRATDGVAAIEA